MDLNETCKHDTKPIYRCPVNADHDEVSLSDKPGECSECSAELEMI